MEGVLSCLLLVKLSQHSHANPVQGMDRTFAQRPEAAPFSGNMNGINKLRKAALSTGGVHRRTLPPSLDIP